MTISISKLKTIKIAMHDLPWYGMVFMVVAVLERGRCVTRRFLWRIGGFV